MHQVPISNNKVLWVNLGELSTHQIEWING